MHLVIPMCRRHLLKLLLRVDSEILTLFQISKSEHYERNHTKMISIDIDQKPTYTEIVFLQ